jgi:hypothetical protein
VAALAYAMGKKVELKKVDGGKLLEKLPKAILEGASVRSVAVKEGLSQANATTLANAIGTSIEQFNEKLANELGRVSMIYLKKIEEAADSMPAASLGYTFAVLVDKRTAITGRTNPAGSSVNIQINNHGLNMSKEDIVDILHGKKKLGADNATMEATSEAPPETQPQEQAG